MNTLLVVFAGAIACGCALDQALVDEMTEKVQEIGLDCVTSEKATDEDIEALMNKQPPVTQAGRCVLFCVAKKFEIMSDDGKITTPKTEWLDKVKADDPEIYGKIKGIYDTCSKKVEIKPDSCDTALEFASCAKTESEKVGLNTGMF